MKARFRDKSDIRTLPTALSEQIKNQQGLPKACCPIFHSIGRRAPTVDAMMIGGKVPFSREDAESEVVRFLKRRALRDEGAPGQNPDDVFIGIFGLIVIWAAVAEFAPLQDLPAAVISPY